MQEIRKAQVLIYDALIDTRLLDFTIENCEKICVGKRSGRHSMKQEEINMLLIEKAKEGAHVVRLKGGDPFDVGKIANIDRIEFVFDQEFTDTFDTVRRSLFARQKQAFPSFR